MTISNESTPFEIPMSGDANPAATTPGPDHAAESPSAKPVAKVAAVGVSGVILVIVVAILSGIAPGAFDGLGVWGPVVSTAVTALALFIYGYVKKA